MSQPLGLPAEPLRWAFQQLLAAYGPQHWWPAQSAFEVMLGAILTQNTAWTNVEKAIANLRQAEMLDTQRLAEADPAQLAQIIRPVGYFNIKTQRLQAFCRFYLQQGHERLAALSTDVLRQTLLGVKGVGRETADDMLLYAFERPVFVIDAYSRRLFSRLGLCQGDEPYDSLRLGLEQALRGDVGLYNEYHGLIVRHAKQHCRKRPLCADCPLRPRCAQAQLSA
ncbi:MAG: endonuclease [Gammaproteobacteria bacterium SHHR-1]|uniref:endonuclease III domain-containing protein n=1 Tax=Magnetovirga frankeli TaxID=947516 RepID=UPI0012930689|nr:endonuclease [gamma proteobacterium SS-5]